MSKPPYEGLPHSVRHLAQRDAQTLGICCSFPADRVEVIRSRLAVCGFDFVSFRQAQSQLSFRPKDRRSDECCKNMERKWSRLSDRSSGTKHPPVFKLTDDKT